MTVTDRTDAPAPSPYEQAEIDRFGMFAEERVVEEVIKRSLDSDDPNDWTPRALAAAAVAAYRAAQDGGAEEADAAVECIAEKYRDPTLARFAINDFRDWLADR